MWKSEEAVVKIQQILETHKLTYKSPYDLKRSKVFQFLLARNAKCKMFVAKMGQISPAPQSNLQHFYTYKPRSMFVCICMGQFCILCVYIGFLMYLFVVVGVYRWFKTLFSVRNPKFSVW